MEETGGQLELDVVVEEVSEGETQDVSKEQRLFTQDEVNKMLGKAKRELKAKIPADAEWDEFSLWKENREIEANEREKTGARLAELEDENKKLGIKSAILEAGIPVGLVRYAITHIDECGDIMQGIEEFKGSEFYKSVKRSAGVSFGAKGQKTERAGSVGKEEFSQMNYRQKLIFKEKNPEKYKEYIGK